MRKRVIRIGLTASLVAGSLMIGSAGPVSAEGGNNQVVRIARFSFHPNDFTVAPAASIRVINYDGCRHEIPHTFTSTQQGGFDSGILFCDEAIVTAPEQPGRWTFFCEIHPGMRGVLHVE
jgi:plastocyanin